MAGKKQQSGTASDSAANAPANGEAVVKSTRKHLTYEQRLARSLAETDKMLANIEEELVEAKNDAQAAADHVAHLTQQRDTLKAVVDAQKASVKPKDEVSA